MLIELKFRTYVTFVMPYWIVKYVDRVRIQNVCHALSCHKGLSNILIEFEYRTYVMPHWIVKYVDRD